MTTNDLACCIVVGLLMLVMLILSILLLRGKGAWLIAGYNMTSKEEQARYDRAALCKFMGKYLLSITLLMPALPIGGIFHINWLLFVYIAYLLLSTGFVLVYCNTGNRFRK